jgi:hypothetical protein
MATRYAAHNLKVLGAERVQVNGAFRPNGASGIVTGSKKSFGYSVARTSLGLYTVTFDSPWAQLMEARAHVRSADGMHLGAVIGDYNATAGTLQIRVRRGSPVWVPLPLGDLREVAANAIQNIAANGGILASDTTPVLERVNGATDKALRVRWVAGNVDECIWGAIPLPPAAEAANVANVHTWFEKDANANTVTCDVQAFLGKGDTEMGAPTSTIGQTLAKYVTTLAAADMAAFGASSFLNLALVPSAHAGDALHLYGAGIEFETLADLASDADNEVFFSCLFKTTAGKF